MSNLILALLSTLAFGSFATVCFIVAYALRFSYRPKELKPRVYGTKFKFVEKLQRKTREPKSKLLVSNSQFEEIYNLVLGTYVNPWYCRISSSLILTLDIKLEFIKIEKLLKLRKVDFGKFVTNKVIPVITNHFRDVARVGISDEDIDRRCKFSQKNIERFLMITLSEEEKHSHLVRELLVVIIEKVIAVVSDPDLINLKVVGQRNEAKELKAILEEYAQARGDHIGDWDNRSEYEVSDDDDDDDCGGVNGVNGDGSDDGRVSENEDDEVATREGHEESSDTDASLNSSGNSETEFPMDSTDLPVLCKIQSTIMENKKTIFIIEVQTQLKAGWLVGRRFNQFRDLHAYVGGKYKFPLVFANSRKEQLEAFLNDLIKNEVPIAQKFLQQGHFSVKRPTVFVRFVTQMMKIFLSMDIKASIVRALRSPREVRTDAQKLKTQREAMEMMKKYSLVLDLNSFQLLQNQDYNKCLVYSIVDELINELSR